MQKLTFLLLLSIILSTGCREDHDLIFHDTFDYYDVNVPPKGPWEIQGKGMVRVDTIRSFSGKQSLYFESGEGFENRAFAVISGNPLIPFAYNRISGSMMIWIEDIPATDGRWTMLQGVGQVRDKEYKAEVRYGGELGKRLMANYETQGVATDCWQHSHFDMPEKEWVKISWFIESSTNQMQFWMNEELVEDLTVTLKGTDCHNDDLDGEWIFPLFEEVMIGWADYQTGGGRRKVWIDDVKFFQ